MLDNMKKNDPEIEELIEKELERQQNCIELIASENIVSRTILEANGSILTNKYAEGYSGNRYYGGCEYIDQIENIAIERACKLFNCKYANVQPHSGSHANQAAYLALLEEGDHVLSISLDRGGHLTHFSPASLTGKMYDAKYYTTDETGYIDYNDVERLAIEHKPKLILTGYSAYPRKIDFKRFREIADKVGAYLMADIAHIAGLVAAGVHESPFPYCDIVTSTTHKTLRGPRSGIILTNSEEIIKKVNRAIFPNTSGGPHEHTIAAKAIAFKEAMSDEFKEYAKQIVKNASLLSEELKKYGFELVTGGTDNHLILIDLRSINMTGLDAQHKLEDVRIATNKNTVPNETQKPSITSGLRIGTPAVTTRGFVEEDIIELAKAIKLCLIDNNKTEAIEIVEKLTKKYPIYKGL